MSPIERFMHQKPALFATVIIVLILAPVLAFTRNAGFP